MAPYEYLGWGSPQQPTSVMSATGVKWLTLAYKLKAIDVDIEATEFSNGTVQQRVIDALRIVKPMSPTRR